MTMRHRNRLFIIFVVTALVAAAVILYIIEPLRTSIRAVGDELLEQQATLELRTSTEIGSGQRLEEITRAESSVDDLMRVTIRRADALSFITLLEDLARVQNVELTLALPDVQPSDDIQEVTLSVTLVGTFDALLATLESIEHLGPYFNIPALTFVPNARTAEGTTVQLTFSAVTYWR